MVAVSYTHLTLPTIYSVEKKKIPLLVGVRIEGGGGVRGSSGVGGKPHGPHMAMSRIRKL